jgi:hypothetical protein
MLTALAVTTLSVGSAQALTIDNFTTNQLVVDGSGGGAAFSTVFDIVNILGTDRTISVANITYNGIGGDDLGGVDLTEDGSLNAFGLLVVAGDFSTNIALTVSDGANTSSLMIPTPGLASFMPLFFAYAPFVAGPVDFT